MNVATITMDRDLARAKLKAYRADLHKDSEQLYRQTEKAYEALAAGLPLLRLSQVIARAGVDLQCRPKLAICRADRKEVKVWLPWRREHWVFESGPFDWNGSQRSQVRRSDLLRREVRRLEPGKDCKPGFAIVPMVPADVRPKTGQLKDWFILWEVEHWADRPHFATASPDPILLTHIGGDLYAVLASWDLTPIEQAILEGAMR